MYDVIVVGSGHNGLTTAAYLAAAGRRVVVLESRPVLGGMTTTEATVAEAPDFLMNGCAIDLILSNIRPSIIDDLQLHRHGLRMLDIDPYVSHVRPDGTSLAIWRDLDRTVAEIACFSRRDAERYRKLANAFNDLWHTAQPYLMGHPKRVPPRTLGQVAWRAARNRKDLMTAARIMVQPPQQVIEEWFEHDVVKTTMALWAVASIMPFDEPGSSGVIAGYMLTHRFGCRRPLGGMGRLPQALASYIHAHNGEIRLSSPVASIDIAGGEARGVTLSSGEQLRAGHVVGALDPMTLMSYLVAPADLPEPTRDELRGMTVGKNNLSFFKADVALSERPRLANVDRSLELLSGGYVMIGEDYQYMLRHQELNRQGAIGDAAPFYLALPSIIDRSLVGNRAEGETLYLYVPSTPRELAGDATWQHQGESYLATIMATLDKHAPGVVDSVRGSYIKSPPVFEKQTYNAHPYHVDISLSQLGPWRPTPSLSGYRTPIDRLWHTGAGAHPFPAVHGWGARTTAREILRSSRKAPARGEEKT